MISKIALNYFSQLRNKHDVIIKSSSIDHDYLFYCRQHQEQDEYMDHDWTQQDHE